MLSFSAFSFSAGDRYDSMHRAVEDDSVVVRKILTRDCPSHSTWNSQFYIASLLWPSNPIAEARPAQFYPRPPPCRGRMSEIGDCRTRRRPTLQTRGPDRIASRCVRCGLRPPRPGAIRFPRLTSWSACGATRPTAVNLHWALERMSRAAQQVPGDGDAIWTSLAAQAAAIWEDDRAMCRRIGEFGLPLIRDGTNVLTHCNAGALATGGIGTALAPIYLAHEAGRQVHVYVGETRPLLQGARLTAWELTEAGCPARSSPTLPPRRCCGASTQTSSVGAPTASPPTRFREQDRHLCTRRPLPSRVRYICPRLLGRFELATGECIPTSAVPRRK